MSDLKPCPFCLSEIVAPAHNKKGWRVKCLHCESGCRFDKKEDAIMAWNLRESQLIEIKSEDDLPELNHDHGPLKRSEEVLLLIKYSDYEIEQNKELLEIDLTGKSKSIPGYLKSFKGQLTWKTPNRYEPKFNLVTHYMPIPPIQED